MKSAKDHDSSGSLVEAQAEDVEAAGRAPGIAILGPLLGSHPGWVTSQGEILAELFRGENLSVLTSSNKIRPIPRVVDMVRFLIKHRRDIDLVLLMAFSGRGFAVVDALSRTAGALGKPLVLWLHGGNLPELRQRRPGWVQAVLRRAQAIVAPSTYLASQFRCGEEAIEIIPNVVDFDACPYELRTVGGPRLLWMRTFHEVYNPALALEVLVHLRQKRPETTLTMAGQDKGLLEETRRRAIDFGLADAVNFPGFLDAAGKRRAFAEHDVFLNTNRIDNAPVSVLEAAASGLPIVATSVGGLPYLLEDQVSGLLVPDNDSMAMAAAVARLWQSPALVERLSAQAREVALASSWSQVRTRWHQLFQRLGVAQGSLP